jgi:hypothetical protein
MSYNLFVAFDARDPIRETPLILAAIEELGEAVRLFSTFWYVRSPFTAAEAARRLWDLMQTDDALIVVNASLAEAACFNVTEDAFEWMQKRWHLRLDEPLYRTAERTEPLTTQYAPLSRTAPQSAPARPDRTIGWR